VLADPVLITLVYPELLGTYGDGGNAVILAERLRWRGVAAEVVRAELGAPLPRTSDIYLLGGGEDAPQSLAAAELRRDGALGAAVAAGAVVLGVCAGLQVLGTKFAAGGTEHAGVGVVGAESVRRLRRRAVGELAVEPASELGLPRLSGYENHASRTVLGPGVSPLGRVVAGVGNGDRSDGVIAGRVVGTYLHGPVLARNPELADLLLGWVLGELPPLDPRGEAADRDAVALRAGRLAAAGPARRWGR